jgi:hypothetical protein
MIYTWWLKESLERNWSLFPFYNELSRLIYHTMIYLDDSVLLSFWMSNFC